MLKLKTNMYKSGPVTNLIEFFLKYSFLFSLKKKWNFKGKLSAIRHCTNLVRDHSFPGSDFMNRF